MILLPVANVANVSFIGPKESWPGPNSGNAGILPAS